MAVALARVGEHGIGTGLDAAFGHAREVNPQERKSRIGHGVDQVSHQELPLRRDLVVFAAKRNDAVLFGSLLLPPPIILRDDVRLQAAAVDQMFGAVIAAGGLQDDFLGTIEDAHDSLRQTNVAARVTNFLGISRGDFFVIDDAGFGNVETFDAGGVRFEFFQPLRPDNF